ncbi:hypothetical protein [Tellurirhabdus bombi]|uniref:hypothetical protein n=1 Tax=Tellurirhabdus bombi TaxID=2907205 RepID=UPI001F418DCC|nr:hypothetical protein [Tellurirhabdus bombi]
MNETLLNYLSELEPDREQLSLEGVDIKDLHYNYIQLICLLIGAQHLTAVAGRGTGKSEGILAPRLHRLVDVMPRSSIVAIGTTYIQLLDRTLPALLKGMERMGYQRDKDYWIRRFPDKKDNLILPHNCPLDPQHAIFIRNRNSVAALRLVSQDRPGTANGLSVNAIIGDEAKFLNKPKLDTEVLAINRGDEELFGHIAEHHSTTFTTDMPTTRDGDWILKEEDECLKPQHQEAIRLILAVQLEIYKEKKRLKIGRNHASRLQRIAKYESYLNELRRSLVHYASASSFANVHALGLGYFKRLFRTLPPLVWNTAVLNKRMEGVENGFYPDFDPKRHYYDSVDYAYVDGVDFLTKGFNDCRKDADIDHKKPLVIAMDYGASFNCLWVGQRTGNVVRWLNCFGLASPHKTQDVVRLFCKYYKYFYLRHVEYVFNHTAIVRDGKSDLTYSQEVMKVLTEEGWKFTKKYTGQTPSYHGRYLAWGIALKEGDARFPVQRFNRENTMKGVSAMQHARTREGSKGFEKDKRDEKNMEVDQSTTTHYTDAADELFWYLSITSTNSTDLLPAIFTK